MSEKLFTMTYDEKYKKYKIYELRTGSQVAGFVWLDANRAWRFQQKEYFGGFTIQEVMEILEFMQGLEGAER